MIGLLIVLAILAGTAFYIAKRSKAFRENPPTNPTPPPAVDPNEDPRTR